MPSPMGALLCLLSALACTAQQLLPSETLLPAAVAAAVDASAPDIARVAEALTVGRLKGETWGRLAEFTDTVGNRLAEPSGRLPFRSPPPLPLVGVSIGMERGRQQNDRTLADG